MAPNQLKRYHEVAPLTPTSATRRQRKNLLYQFYRFIVLNLKIMRIIIGGHS
jgi:hypothetical protein